MVNLVVNAYSWYFLDVWTSQCSVQILPSWIKLSELMFSGLSVPLFSWAVFFSENRYSITIINAFKWGIKCMVSEYVLLCSGIAVINWLNDAAAVLIIRLEFRGSWWSFITVLIASCTIWWTRIKAPLSSSSNKTNEHLLSFKQINSLSAACSSTLEM